MKGWCVCTKVCLMLTLFICCSCGGDDAPATPVLPVNPVDPDPVDPVPPATPEVNKADRTVILYFAGDNSLSTFLKNDKQTGDLDELLQGAVLMNEGFFNNHNLLLFVDTAEEETLPAIYRLTSTAGEAAFEVVKAFNEDVVSSDPAVIQDVLDEVIEKYPAESYGFVYWSHGDGWVPAKVSGVRSFDPVRFIGSDQQNGTLKTADALKTEIADLAKVLESVGKPFEFVMFDACYMLSVETAYAMRKCAKYLIASPTETPAAGAPYDQMLPLMFASQDAALSMGKAFYTSYEQKYDDSSILVPPSDNWYGGVAIGVIDCSALENLANVTAQGLSDVSSTDNETLRSEILHYDKRASVGRHYYFDMEQLMQKLMPAEAFNRWQTVYHQALPVWNATPKFFSSASRWFSLENAHGITHFIPQSQDASTSLDEAYRSTSWYRDAGLNKLGW